MYIFTTNSHGLTHTHTLIDKQITYLKLQAHRGSLLGGLALLEHSLGGDVRPELAIFGDLRHTELGLVLQHLDRGLGLGVQLIGHLGASHDGNHQLAGLGRQVEADGVVEALKKFGI